MEKHKCEDYAVPVNGTEHFDVGEASVNMKCNKCGGGSTFAYVKSWANWDWDTEQGE